MIKKLLGMLVTILLVGLISMASSQTGLAVSAGAVIQVTTSLDQIVDDDDCSLREAIQAANLNQAFAGCPAGSGQDTIMLPSGSYALSIQGQGEDQGLIGDLDIREPLTILGAGIDLTNIDGKLMDRIFHVVPQNIRISWGVGRY
jgi:CSLREA domain-containing protein